jgi:ABC-2 type transport system permease protein
MKGSLRRVTAIIIRHLFAWRRDIESLFEAIWWPSFDVLLWGLMTVYISSGEGASQRIVAFIVGAIFLWMFVYRSQQEISFAFLKEVWDRNLMSILTSPISITEYMAATLILGIVKLLLSVVWLSFLSYFLFSFNILNLGTALLPFVVNLFLVGWWAGFFINGMIVRYGYRVQSFAWSLLVVIQPFSAVFYPVSSLPVWMQRISSVIPTSYVFEGMRNVLSGNPVDPKGLGTAMVLNLVYLILSLIYFRYSFKKALENGMIVKFN